jgi:hypothetical protein
MSKQNKTRQEAQKQEQDKDQGTFPGYPPYPAEDDITRNSQRVDGNFGDESFDATKNGPPVAQSADAETTGTIEEKEEVPASPYELTEEDLEALGPKDLSLDLGEDEQLKHRTHPVDFAGEDLDVPGTNDDDESEKTGSEDEENNPYSLGGDAHSNLEEGRQ